MESSFNNRDFERFLKQNADQYRMIPSERVWGGIHNTLHNNRRRWLVFGLSLLFLTASVVTWVMLLPGNKGLKQAYLPAGSVSKKITKDPVNASLASTATGPVKPGENDDNFMNAPAGFREDFFAITNPGTADEYATTDIAVVTSLPVSSSLTSLPATNGRYTEVAAALKQKNLTASPDYHILPVNAPETRVAAPVADSSPSSELTAETPAGQPAAKEDAEDEHTPVIRDRVAKSSTQKLARKSLKWQLYVTPTISYRSLSENIDFLAASRYNNAVNGGPAVVYPSDVNTMVNHRPDMGFQLGVRAAYPLSRWFSLTGGFQFTVSKYDIKAYQHPAEVATIALSDRNVSTISNYRNTNGIRENWLRNFYFTASLPVGAELKLSDGNRNYFGIAATLQPTYVLDNRAYLISSDYKNYAEMPSLTRRWNMNSSFEVFSAHTTGKVSWRVGPQVRYQVMSSFVRNYPIKEHLFDFGLKLGIQLK